ncbi:hypothetical protein Dsin_030584 [Dipteronia sinensis]|uniref:Germin-like protein n=1 Tax=Dipteronia sinensis TaxID=43782 RepID=A0AAD9ZKB8_9ROSI|nr:hypothetical protein Dsin_030584 [Dipteronia sinensis]
MNSSLVFCIFCFTTLYLKICLADPDNLQDACPAAPTGKDNIFINGLPCKNPANITASDFKTSKLKNAGDTDNFLRFSMILVTAFDFPGLNTLGLSVARTDIDVDGIVPPHSHPRASEILFVFEGVVIAGFIDTNSKVFQKVLKAGDVFVFPKGLLHFCFNSGFDSSIVFSVLSSQNPGVISINDAMFQPDFNVINKLVRKFISLSADNHIPNVTFQSFNNP